MSKTATVMAKDNNIAYIASKCDSVHSLSLADIP